MQNKRSILEYNWARDSVSFDVWCLKQSNKKLTFLSTIAFVKGLKGCILGYLITLSETNTNWGRGGTGRVNPKSLQFIEKKQGGDTIIFKSSFFSNITQYNI